MAEKKTAVDKPAVSSETESTAGGTNLLVKTEGSTDLAEAEDDFFAGAGQGLEDFQQSDLLIPYVRIIQALSKELQRNHAKYIEGAKQGEFVNSATRKTMDGDEGFIAIPVGFSHRYMAWRPNNAGPAYDMGTDPSKFNAIEPDDKGKRLDAEGNEMTDALQYFVILVSEKTGEYEISVINFAGSQMRKGKGWATTINNRMERHPTTKELIRPAIFFYSYKVTSVPESNDKGSWYGFSISEGPKVMDLPNGREIFRNAKELRMRIDAGDVKGAVDRSDDDEAGAEKAF